MFESIRPDFMNDWDLIYKDTKFEDTPWYNPVLDSDIVEFLDLAAVKPGTLLDLGTGPGTQAAAFRDMGFTVTATDISQIVISQLESKYEGINFLLDDILQTKLVSKFDYILDRGVFHTILPEMRSQYINSVKLLLNPSSLLMLKTFSKDNEELTGPYQFNEEDIKSLFGNDFEIIHSKKGKFVHPDATFRHALLTVLKSR